MKTTFFCVFVLFACRVWGQQADSLAVAREVDSLIRVSRTLTHQGDFKGALEINALAEKNTLERLDSATAVYANVCYNYGRIFEFQGNFIESEKWYLESKNIRKKVLGKTHQDYALILGVLGTMYNQEGGNKVKAEQYFLEAREVQEKVFGKEHRYYALTTNNLGLVYLGMQKYALAEPLLLEAKTLFENTGSIKSRLLWKSGQPG